VNVYELDKKIQPPLKHPVHCVFSLKVSIVDYNVKKKNQKNIITIEDHFCRTFCANPPITGWLFWGGYAHILLM